MNIATDKDEGSRHLGITAKKVSCQGQLSNHEYLALAITVDGVPATLRFSDHDYNGALYKFNMETLLSKIADKINA